MNKFLKKIIAGFMLLPMCFLFSACDLGGPNKSENTIYSEFGNRLYFKGSLYSLSPSFVNTTLYFPILSKNKIESIDNVVFYNNREEKIDGKIVVIPDTRDDKIINENLYLNFVEFQLSIQNVEGLTISKISLCADSIDVSYDVDIDLHYYYLNPEYNITNQGDMLYEIQEDSCTLIYGYASKSSVSKLNYLESMVDGIEIKSLALANGNDKNEIDGTLPWTFQEIENGGENIPAYNNNVLKIECDYSQIREQALFFKDVFRANLSVGTEELDIMLPEITSNALIEIYVSICKELNLWETI